MRTTISRGFFTRTKTLSASFAALADRNLDDLAIDAAPTNFSAMPQRFFARVVTLTAIVSAFIAEIRLKDAAIEATPAKIFAMRERFFARWITLSFPVTAFLWRGLNDFAIDAAPALTGGSRRRCRTMDWRRTRKRILPTRWIFRRTWRMRAGRTVPFVTTATFFPPPTATVLNPDPLATLIVPLAARDSLRRQFERVLVTILGNSVADDDQRVADCSRDG